MFYEIYVERRIWGLTENYANEGDCNTRPYALVLKSISILSSLLVTVKYA